MRLTKRTILITGGTSGIGLALARQLIPRGNTVIVTGRDRARLDDTKRALPGVHVFQSDVSDPAAIVELHARMLERFPALDVLVNNAGIMRNIKLQEPRELMDITREIEINLDGPVRMIQQFLPHLMTMTDSAIVNVSSGLAFIPFASSPIYSATKAAIHAYTQTLRAQLEGTNVTVIELAPPGVETPLFRGEFEEETKGQSPMAVAELARRAIAAVESGSLEIRPGLSNVLRIMSRVAPGFMFRQLAKSGRPKAAVGRNHRAPSVDTLTP